MMASSQLAHGAMLGPYEIGAPIGAGGMGEVYRARDTRLQRTVAIKVVAGALSTLDEDENLEREARAVAALNHQHICALHDVGRDHGTPFLVMEFVEGETLAERLTRGPLPARDVIRYAIQIAEALDHAHRHGVVHRDLKPANIMLTKSGVKVLDFGLATLRAAAPVQVPLERTPTAVHQLTSERALLGTVHYLAPERLEGKEADAASDLFSLGAVMYEMATGRRPFESGSPAGVIAAILRIDPPPPSTLQSDLPPALDWIILKCLAKNPDTRWQAAGDLVEILRWTARSTERPEPPAPPRRRWFLPLAAAMLMVAAILSAAVAGRFRTESPRTPPLTFSIAPPPKGGFTPTPSSVPSPQFALSPNGRRLAFVASAEHETSQLWIRSMDSLNAEPVPGTQEAEYPFWSSDSESIGFFAHGLLKRVDLAGGPARILAPAPHGRGGAWSRDGLILFASNTQTGLHRIPAAGGTATPATVLGAERRETSHRWPQFLPDDRHFIYFVQGTTPDVQGIYIDDIDHSAPRKLLASGLSATFAPPDHLLFVAEDALMASAFDWRKQRLTGEPFAVALSVAGSSNFFGAFSASDTGLLVYASSAASSELVWITRDGHHVGTLGSAAEYVDFRLSPDDQQLAVSEVDPQTHRPAIRVFDLVRGAKIRLTYEHATDASPVWSPDGQQIVFRANRSGVHDLYRKAANGAGVQSLVLQSQSAKYPTDWTRDGRIIYHTYERDTGSDIWVMSADGSRAAPLVQTGFHEMQAHVSADGQWLAYTSLESGQAQVYIRNLVDPSRRWQVSSDGGTDPRWRGDNRELFYVSAESWLMAVDFAGAAPGLPQRLFQVRVLPPRDPYLSSYDVTNDAKRFLFNQPVHDVTSMPLRVVTDWVSARRGS